MIDQAARRTARETHRSTDRGRVSKPSVGNTDSISSARRSSKVRVLLTNTDRWPAPARLAVSLSKVGCDVSALCPIPGHPLSKTQCVETVFSYDGYHPLRSLKSAIEKWDPQIVVPCDDLAVQHLHELYRDSCETGEVELVQVLQKSLGSPGSYPIVSSRYDVIKIAAEEGILVPDTMLLKSLDDLRAWQKKGRLPVVIKADGTWGGRGVRIAHSLEGAEEAFRELSQRPGSAKVIKRLLLEKDRSWLRSWWLGTDPVITAQSHIDGRPANCAVACWQGEMLAGIAVEVVSAQELTGPATVVRVVDSAAMLTAARLIARRLGLSGFFGLDFMIDHAGGAIYLIEMNPRCTPLCHLQLGKGRDMVAALFERLTGSPHREAPATTGNDLIAYYPQALQSATEFLQSSFVDIPQDEPQLIDELLNPWSGRSPLGRLLDRVRPASLRRKAPKPCVFEGAILDRAIM
jgi:ATP-grasp domain